MSLQITSKIEAAEKEAKKTELTAKEYFDALKDARQELTDNDIKTLAESSQMLMSRAMITGQDAMVANLKFVIKNIERMIALQKLGFNTYVMRSDIETFTKLVVDKSVYIVEIEKFKRVIPDDVVTKIGLVKHLFDAMYIVYTDYSADSKDKGTKKKIEKDPIVFGAFRNKEDKMNYDRMFYIADWVDEYCQLTFTEMLNTMAAKGYKGIDKTFDAKEIVTINGLKDVINKNAVTK